MLSKISLRAIYGGLRGKAEQSKILKRDNAVEM